jgi:hypothetical protein
MTIRSPPDMELMASPAFMTRLSTTCCSCTRFAESLGSSLSSAVRTFGTGEYLRHEEPARLCIAIGECGLRCNTPDRTQQFAQMPLAEDNDMIKATTSDRADEPLRISIFPRRAWRDRPIPDAHGPHALNEPGAVDAIPITDDVAARFASRTPQ